MNKKKNAESLLCAVLRAPSPSSSEIDYFKDMRAEIHKYVSLDEGYLSFFDGNPFGKNLSFLQKLLWEDVILPCEKENERWDVDAKIHCTYKNGKLHGSYKEYYGEILHVHSNYQNGLLDGDHKEYWGAGNLFAHFIYKNGKRISPLEREKG